MRRVWAGFNKQTMVSPRNFDNANQWAGADSVGGPLKKNKIFGFIDNESGPRLPLIPFDRWLANRLRS